VLQQHKRAAREIARARRMVVNLNLILSVTKKGTKRLRFAAADFCFAN